MKEKNLVTVKIREEYRNMAKIHSENTGIKMYILIEQAIQQICTQQPKMKVK